jgi:dihydrofolate reductase
MIISIIVAASSNNVIGSNNRLPWRLPTDMKFFKNTTWGMPVIMGRKTFESMNKKALPGRKNIIITRQENFKPKDTVVVSSFNDALDAARETDCKEVFVIGGGEIFKTLKDTASRIYMTRVHTVLEGDIFFPDIDKKEWKQVSRRDCFADEKHEFDFTIERWERSNNKSKN